MSDFGPMCPPTPLTDNHFAKKPLTELGGTPPTMGEYHSFWLLKRFLIFQGISGDLDVDLLKHITQKIK